MSNFRIYNTTLCPDLWDEYQHLDPRIRVNLLRLAYDFYKKTNFKSPISDIYLMGSIANYNWTPDSDCDVHLMVDYNALQMPADTANKMVKTVGAAWNSEHNVLIKGHKVEMNMQNVHEVKPHVTGIYSLIKDEWVRRPSMTPPVVDKASVQTQFKAMKTYIDSAVASGDRETMKSAKEYLDAYRQYGLDTYGELSQQNIVFKILRSKGIIKNLKNAITTAYDREMSVAEVSQKDMAFNLPKTPSQYRYTDSGDLKLDTMTLDNLNALRAKAARMVKGSSGKDDAISRQINQQAMQDYIRFNAEIKKRLAQINRPITETDGEKQDYIGGIVQGEVRGEPVKAGKVRFYMHHDFPGLFSGANQTNWRYHADKNQVTWNLEPDPEDKVRVNDFLAKRGINGVRHKPMYTGGSYRRLEEGVGAGKIGTDRLEIPNEDGSIRRWQIRSKDAPKTPSLEDCIDEAILLMESPEMKTLKKNKKPLTPEERKIVMNSKAVWHHGSNGEATPAVWKATIKGKTWYVTNTHRAYQAKPTLKGAINAYHKFIKSTA
jgi:hypothetical protein